MRTLLLILVAFLAFSCGNKSSQNQAKKEKTTQIKVAAYNVEFSKNASATEIGEALKGYNFDVVCFSEAPGGDWTKEVALVMGLDHIVPGKYSTPQIIDAACTVCSESLLRPLCQARAALSSRTVEDNRLAMRCCTNVGLQT